MTDKARQAQQIQEQAKRWLAMPLSGDPREAAAEAIIQGLLTALSSPSPDSTEVLQAVLEAIKGTLDTSTQIADHPNVKFAQMQRLKLLEGASPSPSDPIPLRRCVRSPGKH